MGFDGRHHGRVTLLVASTGGHLEELIRLRDRFEPEVGPVEWVTFDDPQSRSLLAKERVHFVGYIPPRGYAAVAKSFWAAQQLFRKGDYAQVVSTGSGIAMPFLVLGRAMGLPCHYIESAARASGPSRTGACAARVPGVHLYSQYESWASGRWVYRGSLFDGFEAAPSPSVPIAARKVVVTLGTMRTYGFRTAVDRLLDVLPPLLAPDADVLWQVGSTDVTGLNIESRERITGSEMRLAIECADLVVAHAGIGSALTALDAGKCPVLLPRREHRHEHVDDHQLMIAQELGAGGLAVTRDSLELTTQDLQRAMSVSVTRREVVRPFALGG